MYVMETGDAWGQYARRAEMTVEISSATGPTVPVKENDTELSQGMVNVKPTVGLNDPGVTGTVYWLNEMVVVAVLDLAEDKLLLPQQY